VLLLISSGCSNDPGQVHAKKHEIPGIYEAKFQEGIERLELKRDGTYLQAFIRDGKPTQHLGSWKMEDHFLGGTDIILVGAVVSEDDPIGSAQRIGDRTLNVHRRSGKLALAVNEVADWYFIPVQ